MSGGIYEIRNTVNGKYYVGRAECFRTRFNRHRYELRHGRHHCLYLQRAWTKYGEEAFDFVEVAECDLEAAIQLETERLQSGDERLYNVSRFSSGGDLLSQHPEREQIIARRNGGARRRMASLTLQERVRLYSWAGEQNGMYGRRHTEAARQQMSETTRRTVKRGAEHPSFGLKRSATTRAKLSKIASARLGQKNPFYGKSHSQATKDKLAAGRRGRQPTNVRAVVADGLQYPLVRDAARHLGISSALVIYRIKSPKYAYSYAATAPQGQAEQSAS
ncbi:NUMOD3 domain-containing DNA-binding protein [Deinococcus aquaedulcis]|uniref:NUMOD3 domain-containing DNA-binding protein n=1 Tax=Deinococcus aquaedulcis TaxID=2840455 RepID=UPI001C83DA33|nr:NUMOD3 domain-containing DNA-binding protein [Deinococcus aquaedulcis]